MGYDSISATMKDSTLRRLVEIIGYDEGLKVVVDPKIVNPRKFLDEVIEERISNSFIPDTPQRIATDTLQKVGVRFGGTIKAYIEREDLNLDRLVGIPLAIAAWCRYLVGIDDEGNSLSLNPDLHGKEFKRILDGISLGDKILE